MNHRKDVSGRLGRKINQTLVMDETACTFHKVIRSYFAAMMPNAVQGELNGHKNADL